MNALTVLLIIVFAQASFVKSTQNTITTLVAETKENINLLPSLLSDNRYVLIGTEWDGFIDYEEYIPTEGTFFVVDEIYPVPVRDIDGWHIDCFISVFENLFESGVTPLDHNDEPKINYLGLWYTQSELYQLVDLSNCTLPVPNTDSCIKDFCEMEL